MFVVIEGINGVGKTTLANKLADKFSFIYLKEPGGTSLGETVIKVLQSQEPTSLASLYLYAAARAQLVERVIVPALDSGENVVLDRFTDSTEAYQGRGEGFSVGVIKLINLSILNGLKPDKTILLVAPVSVAQGRAHKGNWNNTGLAYMERVQRGFIEIMQHKQNSLILDATQPESVIYQSTIDWIVDNRAVPGEAGVLEVH